MTDESGGLLALVLVLVAVGLLPLWVVSVELLALWVVSDGLLAPALALLVVGGAVLHGGGLYPPR
jgi:hypothetical protein